MIYLKCIWYNQFSFGYTVVQSQYKNIGVLKKIPYLWFSYMYVGLEIEYTHNWHLWVIFDLIVVMFYSEEVCCLLWISSLEFKIYTYYCRLKNHVELEMRTLNPFSLLCNNFTNMRIYIFNHHMSINLYKTCTNINISKMKNWINGSLPS